MPKRSFFTLMARRWHAERARQPHLPAVLTLLVLNLAYFAWSQAPSATQTDSPPQINPNAVVLLSPEEGQRREAKAQAQVLEQAAARAKPAALPDMLVEYESTPAKEIPPER